MFSGFLAIFVSMKKIAVISSSVRDGRLSHRIALFLRNYLAEREDVEAEVLDLREYDFPLFHERFMNMTAPAAPVADYVGRFKEADGIIVVSPVYNGSFPAALKNVIDLLYTEWSHKPVSIVSVTYGDVPGITTVQGLQAILLKMNARVAAPLYTVVRAGRDFAEDGTPADRDTAVKYAKAPVDELLWLVDRSKDIR